MNTGFAFRYPWMLLNLLWLPLWFWIAMRVWQAKRFLMHSSIQPFQGLQTQPQKIPLLLRMGTLACIIFALARPQSVYEITHHDSNGVDMMLALDLSTSMLIPDFTSGMGQRTTRIEAAKGVLKDFIQQRQEDRIGLVSFARYPYLVSPLTLNHEWLLQNLKRLNAGLIEDGTAIGSAVTMCLNRLKELSAKTRLIILLTDGVNNFGDVTPTLAANIAKSFQTKIYAIMIGNDQVFPTDEQTLAQMAETTGGRFYRAYDLKSLQSVYQEIDTLEKTKVKQEGSKSYGELFFYCLYAATALLLLEQFLKTHRYRITA